MTAPSLITWSPEPGAKVLEFELTRRLGSGGMGAVFEARAGERVVALKVLSKLDDLSLRMRFSREAEAMARVDSHPNILRIHGVHLEFEPPFLLLELVQGKNLRELLRERGGRPLPLSRALEIARDLHSALRCLHENGLLHRDVKAENILIDESSGRAMLADFGLASVQDGQSLTRSGEVLGTAGCMAPEQIAGEKLTSAADCWALGVVLYELLTGQAPFRGASSLALMQAVLQGPIPAPSSLRPELPQALSELCLALLRRDREARLSSPESIERALTQNLETQRSSGSRRTVPYAIGIAILLVVGLASALRVRGADPVRLDGESRVIEEMTRRVSDFNFYDASAPDLRGRLRQEFVEVFLSSLPYELPRSEPEKIDVARLESARNLCLVLSPQALELVPKARRRDLERMRTRAEVTLAIGGAAPGEGLELHSLLRALFADLRGRRLSEDRLGQIDELSAGACEEIDGLGELLRALCEGRRPAGSAMAFSDLEMDVLEGLELAGRFVKKAKESRLDEIRSRLILADSERSARRLSLFLREAIERGLRSQGVAGSIANLSISDLFNSLDALTQECCSIQDWSTFQPFSRLIEAFSAQRDRRPAARALEESVERSLASREGLNPQSLREAVRQACVARALGSEFILAARFPFGNFLSLGNSAVLEKSSSRAALAARLEFFLALAAAGVYCTTMVNEEDIKDPRLVRLLTQFEANSRLAAAVRLLRLRLLARLKGEIEKSLLKNDAQSAEYPSLRVKQQEIVRELLVASRSLYLEGGLFDASRDQAFSSYVSTLNDALVIDGLKEAARRDFDVSMTLSWAASAESGHHFRTDWILYILIQCYVKARSYPEECLRLIRQYLPLLDARVSADRPIWTKVIELDSAREHRLELASRELGILESLGRGLEIEPRAREIYARSVGSIEAKLILIEALILTGRKAEALALSSQLEFPEGPDGDDARNFHGKLQTRYEILKPK